MMIELINTNRFREFLLCVCKRDTSSDPDGWTPENLLWGQSAPVSLVAQDVFGGELLRTSLKGTEFSALCFHFWNLLPDNRPQDFTRDQFQGRFPQDVTPAICHREILFRNHQTSTLHGILKTDDLVERYELLRERLAEELRLSEYGVEP